MMDPVTLAPLLLAAVLGAAVGSFLNVVVQRVPRGESVVHPRSRCPGCETPVASRDNVPLLSWLLLRGRCRACAAPIPARYPLVELATAALFVVIVAVRGVEADLALWLPFAAVLVAVAAIDLEHRIIPNRILLPAAVWGLVLALVVRGPAELPEMLIAGGAAFGLFLLAAIAHPAGMGMGDVKLAGLMGLYLGSAVAPALFIAFLGGSIVGVAVLVRHGAAGRKMGVPFGPFLAAGGLVAVLVGPQLVRLYVEGMLG